MKKLLFPIVLLLACTPKPAEPEEPKVPHGEPAEPANPETTTEGPKESTGDAETGEEAECNFVDEQCCLPMCPDHKAADTACIDHCISPGNPTSCEVQGPMKAVLAGGLEVDCKPKV